MTTVLHTVSSILLYIPFRDWLDSIYSSHSLCTYSAMMVVMVLAQDDAMEVEARW